MKPSKTLAAIALFAIVSSANAQTSCEAFTDAIESNLKEISLINVDSIGDNSAPRENSRKTNQLFYMSMINANLLLMQSAKCPLPKSPITQYAYRGSALKCAMAVIKTPGNTPLPECDRTSWVKQ